MSQNATASPVIAIIATLDTKAEEARFLQAWFAWRGYDARLVDVGTAGDPLPAAEPHGLSAAGAGGPLAAGADGGRELGRDVLRATVTAAAGVSLPALLSMRRDEAMAAMGRGAGAVLRGWLRDGHLAGVIGIGGHQGTTIGSLAMRTLPLGLPRVLVSTVASGNVRPFIGHSDIAIVFSVGDLLGGPNRVTRPVLLRAAGMLAGMIGAGAPPAPVPSGVTRGGAGLGPLAAAPPSIPGPAAAITALGNTHAAVVRVMEHLRARGYEVVPFHASGAGGSAMEALVREGTFEGVIDLTPHELVGEVLGDDIYTPVTPGRLTAAGMAGIPQVVAPGGLDYFVFGPEETVPLRYRDRATHHHNPYNTNIRATADELHRVGEALAGRLNGARGPTAFLYPQKGWSHIGREGGPLWDPDANEALRAVVRRLLRPEIRYVEVDARINDARFADAVAAVACEFLAAGPPRLRTRTSAEGGVPC